MISDENIKPMQCFRSEMLGFLGLLGWLLGPRKKCWRQATGDKKEGAVSPVATEMKKIRGWRRQPNPSNPSKFGNAAGSASGGSGTCR
jgi:hypothetical protein